MQQFQSKKFSTAYGKERNREQLLIIDCIMSTVPKKLPVGKDLQQFQSKKFSTYGKEGKRGKTHYPLHPNCNPKKLTVWTYDLRYACLVFSAPQIQIDNFYASTKHMLLKM